MSPPAAGQAPLNGIVLSDALQARLVWFMKLDACGELTLYVRERTPMLLELEELAKLGLLRAHRSSLGEVDEKVRFSLATEEL